MKKIKLNCAATVEETFADFLTSRKAKGLADKTLQSYEQQFRAVARHLDVKTDIALLQKADLDAMIVSMREAGLSSNSINSYTRTLKSFFSWCTEQGISRMLQPILSWGSLSRRSWTSLVVNASFGLGRAFRILSA